MRALRVPRAPEEYAGIVLPCTHPSARSIVEVVVVLHCRRGRRAVTRRLGPAELEGLAKATFLLELLREHIILANVRVRHAAPRKLHRLLKVLPPDLGHGVHLVAVVHGVLAPRLALPLCPDGLLNTLPDGVLARALADLRQIRPRELGRRLGQLLNVDVLGNGRLAEARLEDVEARGMVREGDVDELVQTTRTHERGVDDVGPVGRSDDEYVLLLAHPVHLRKHLVHHAVPSAACVAARAAARACDRVELVEEEDAGGRLPRLVKDLPDVALRLAEPHGEELGALDGDEVGLALVGNGLGEERLAASGGPVKEHAARGVHTKLRKLLRVHDGVLHRLLQLPLGRIQPTDVVPRDVGDLDHRLAQRRGVG
mmetsp:Transcript_38871/g.99305  ORF Transcript_38871/g.99305 Transcript_38871/m.99305 type:complete len:370 (-) Transcript_38871:1412-2521(-)